ncbi:WD40 repeat domain-containing protein [Actinomadura kijaniata]|uniref:WD40 repeat domain-containing protein n=1 Tax=Actinomadura kijaniata TaxID=46161 RepID=UPI000832CB82|nr:WD40 repeat domain-containing protein [Actinomadura kijaniata]
MPTHGPIIVSSPPRGRIHDFDLVVLGGRPLVVATPDLSRLVCTWDPATDLWTEYELDNPCEAGDYTELTALGAAVVDGRIVVGGGGDHQGFALWDLATGKVRLSEEEGGVASTTAADFGGDTLFVVGSSGMGVSLWDPAVVEPEESDGGSAPDQPSRYDFEIEIEEVEARSYAGSAVAAGMLGDRRVVVANGHHDGVLVWDVDDAAPVSKFDDLDEAPTDFALTAVGGRPCVVAAAGRSLLLGDPVTGGWDEPLTAPGGDISCLDAGSVRGRPVAVTGAEDGTICVWDLAGHQLLGRPFREYGSTVHGVRMAELDGRPVVIGAAHVDSVCVWELPV